MAVAGIAIKYDATYDGLLKLCKVWIFQFRHGILGQIKKITAYRVVSKSGIKSTANLKLRKEKGTIITIDPIRFEIDFLKRGKETTDSGFLPLFSFKAERVFITSTLFNWSKGSLFS
ncbi:hypothetical protein M7775_14610 [Sporomusa sphaeroides DSM 2875]|uniref:hypothetical protein n=1 Tax=Sporomusa sphaeroides TaxID=47679 RepID=UPI00202E334E|nr:hypothetical protein [Sporomusa sphaeroides]MCM0759789.1 hypothetical protein [Sporomusa sphaeroides DSM 2875]